MTDTTMRAKLRVQQVIPQGEGESLVFGAVGKSEPYDDNGTDENSTFSKFTPSAQLHMHVANPDLIGKFKIGDTFYVDFSPAPS